MRSQPPVIIMVKLKGLAKEKEKRTKLDPSENKGIFVGYCEVSKAFRIYISGFQHIEISRDVTFDEEMALKKSRRCHLEQVHEEDVPPRKVEAKPSHEIVALEDHDMLEPQEPPTMDISRKRNHTRSREVWRSKSVKIL